MKTYFDHVAKFSKEGDTQGKLVSAIKDYAMEELNQKAGTKFNVITEYSRAEKAQKIQEIFLSEIERRSKIKLSDMDMDVDVYASLDIVNKMAVMLQKIMIDAVQPIFIDATGLAMLAEFHYGGYDDTFSFEVTDPSLYKVSKIGAREKHTNAQRKEKVNKPINTEFYGLTTISTLPEYLRGEANVADDALRMAMSINRKIYQMVVKKFISATASITDTNLIVAGYTEDGLLEKLRLGSAKNGSKMLLVADAVPAKVILPDNTQTRVFLQDEYNTTLGYMSIWNTYNVMAFDVVEDEDGTALGLPLKKIYGMPVDGTKLIHVAVGASGSNTDDYFDNNNLSSRSTLRRQIGVALATNKKVVRVDLA